MQLRYEYKLSYDPKHIKDSTSVIDFYKKLVEVVVY